MEEQSIMGQVIPKLRILSYPITFQNNFSTQGQNMFHTQI